MAFKIFSSTFICFFKKYANESLLFNVQRGSNIEVVLSLQVLLDLCAWEISSMLRFYYQPMVFGLQIRIHRRFKLLFGTQKFTGRTGDKASCSGVVMALSVLQRPRSSTVCKFNPMLPISFPEENKQHNYQRTVAFLIESFIYKSPPISMLILIMHFRVSKALV